MDKKKLVQMWVELKNLEKVSSDKRKEIEAELLEHMNVDETKEGTFSEKVGGYTVKAQCKMTRKVDGDLVQTIANENGISEYLRTLFRWKPEINIKAWKDCSKDITEFLEPAITTKPSKPYFTITQGE